MPNQNPTENLYEALLDQASDGIFVSDPTGRYVIVNDQACRMLDYTRDELLQFSIGDLFPAEDMALAPVDYDTLRAGKTVLIDRRLRRKGGSYIWVEFSAKIIGDGFLQGIARDITERRRMEDELRQSESMYQSLLAQASDGIFVSDPAGKYVLVNDEACRMLGYSREELLQLSMPDILAAEDAAAVPIRFDELYTGRHILSERHLIHKDGRHIPVEISAKMLSDGNFQGIVRDITLRKRMENELRRSEAKYRLLTETMKDVIWTLDTETLYFTYISPSVEHLRGYTPEEILAKPMDDALVPEARSALRANIINHVAEFMARSQPADDFFQISEVEQPCKDGSTVWTEVITRFFLNAETGHIEALGVTRNIAERKQAEAKIQKLNRTLALVNETNQAIIRMRALPDIFEEVCRIAVETGGLWMAWLGLFDPDTNSVTPVAGAGMVGDYLENLNIQLDDPVRSGGPTGMVIRTGVHDIANDIANDPRMIPWRANALRLGFHASAVFPLKVNGSTCGTLNLYSHQPGFFNAEEIALLDDLAADISFAMAFAEEETNRIKAEHALQRQFDLIEEMRVFLQTALDAFPANTVVLDSDGTIINVNQPWIRFNVENNPSPPTDYLRTNYLAVCDAASGDDSEEGKPVANGIRAVISGQQAEFSHEYPCDSPSEERWFIVQATPFPEPPPRRVLLAHINITERKLAERKLQEAHDLLEQHVSERTAELQAAKQQVETILNNNSEGILLLSPDLRIRQTNPAFNRLFAAQPGAYLNNSLFDIICEPDVEAVKAVVLTAITEQIEQRAEIHARRKDAKIIDIKLSIGYIPSGGLVCTISDITLRKQAEESLRKALITEKEMGELKTRFVSMASHEFRTPLATILATTDTLSAYWHRLTETQIEQKFTKVREQVDHLKAIMDDVLTLTRMQSQRVEFNPIPLNLDALCRSVLEEFQGRPDIQHQFGYDCNGPVSEVLLDKKLMRQIISNLLSNAVKYSPAEKPVSIRLAFETGALVLSVADQGIGIPEDDKAHLFEPFHRASNVGAISGTGLGLAITKDAVEMHGGTITVASQPEIGTTFTIRIPTPANSDLSDNLA